METFAALKNFQKDDDEDAAATARLPRLWHRPAGVPRSHRRVSNEREGGSVAVVGRERSPVTAHIFTGEPARARA